MVRPTALAHALGMAWFFHALAWGLAMIVLLLAGHALLPVAFGGAGALLAYLGWVIPGGWRSARRARG